MNFTIDVTLKKKEINKLVLFLKNSKNFEINNHSIKRKRFSPYIKVKINCKTDLKTLKSVLFIDEGYYFRRVIINTKAKEFKANSKDEIFYLERDKKITKLGRLLKFRNDDLIIYQHN